MAARPPLPRRSSQWARIGANAPPRAFAEFAPSLPRRLHVDQDHPVRPCRKSRAARSAVQALTPDPELSLQEHRTAFTALSETGLEVVGAVAEFSGRQDNLAVREAGMVGLAFNALMAIAALVSVSIFIPGQEAE